jgi:hypothetical protein
MTPEILPRNRVSVLREDYCFVVAVDAIPVLRCTVRRDAMRYAVLIRRALLRSLTDVLNGTAGATPTEAGDR